MQLGLSCDLAFDRTAPILSSWNSTIIAPYVRNLQYVSRFKDDDAYSLSIRTGLHTGTVRQFIDSLMSYHGTMSLEGETKSTPWDRISFVAPEYSHAGMAQAIETTPGDCSKLLKFTQNDQNEISKDFLYLDNSLPQFMEDKLILENLDELLVSMHDTARVQLWCCEPQTFIKAMARFYEMYQREIKQNQWAVFYFDPYINYDDSTKLISGLESELRPSVKVIALDDIKTSYYTTNREKCADFVDGSPIPKEEEQRNAIAYSYMDSLYLYGYSLFHNEFVQGEPKDFLKKIISLGTENDQGRYGIQYSVEVEGEDEIRNILLDRNGDQGLKFALFCIEETGVKWSKCLETELEIESGLIKNIYPKNAAETQKRIWPFGIPENKPKCGYDSSNCLAGTELELLEFSIILVCSVLCAILIFGVILAFLRFS